MNPTIDGVRYFSWEAVQAYAQEKLAIYEYQRDEGPYAPPWYTAAPSLRAMYMRWAEGVMSNLYEVSRETLGDEGDTG